MSKASTEIDSQTPKMMVPSDPTAMSTVPTCETRIRDATRLVLSVPQSETIMIQKITIAPTRAKADRTCSERIQSFSSTGREATRFRPPEQQSSRNSETHLALHHVCELQSHRHRLAERQAVPVAARGDRGIAELDRSGAALAVDLDHHGLERLPDASLEQRRLERRDDPRLVLARLAVGELHDVRQLRELGGDPSGNLPPLGERDAGLADVPVDEPAKRRGRVCVGRCECCVLGISRDVPVEGGVAGAAQEAGRRGEERRLPGHVRVQRPDERRIRHLLRPRHSERLRGAAQALEPHRVGGGDGAEDPRLSFEHQLRRGHPGHERDLRVPPLDRKGRAVRKLVPVRALRDFLLGQLQAHAAAANLALLAEDPHLAQEPEHLVCGPVVDGSLDAAVRELLAAADTSLADVDVGALAGLVDVHRPDERGTQLAGKQARRALGELGRIQTRVAVGRVERHTAPVRLLVERAAGRHEGRDVGDRIPHSIARTATFDVQRLVEVLRLRWVDRDELDRGLVRLRQLERRDRPLRVVDDLLRKPDGDLQLASQLGERRLDLDGVGRRQAQLLPRHQESLDSARMGACPACGTTNAETAKFCSECGAALAGAAPVARREERKVVSVVFTDLVGSTARAEESDPEDVRALLRVYHERTRDELERLGGTVEKFIGDAVVAVFGAPVAHEDDPERAVRAALAVRDAVAVLNEEQPGRDLHVRIAVNTGEALVSLDASPGDGEGMVAGDVMNTAARLQSAAPVDGILVGEQTHRATEREIVYREAEPVQAKGKAQPVPVWEAVEPRARLGIDRGATTGAALVGRDDELDLLVDALRRSRRDASTQLVTLVGVPGIGKSRLVSELGRVVDEDDELITWRQGRCLPYGDGVSYWALGEIVKAHAGSGPTVLVCEDLHWADDGLLDFVDALVDWVDGVPLLVICTARPELLERRPGWGGGKRNATTVSLAALDDDATARLVLALLGRPVLDAETQQALVERAAGNPLYAEEFVRMRQAGAAIDERLRESVQGIIAARIDLLPASEKDLLHTAAVHGKVFWSDALASAVDVEPWRLSELLRSLERKEFVRREHRSAVAGATQHAFVHALVRDAAYNQLPRSARAERHLAAAEWIESLPDDRAEDRAETLAHHYLTAIELRRAAGEDVIALGPRAVRALQDAGERALALGAYDAATSFLETALALLPGDAEPSAELLFHAGRAFAHAGRPSDLLVRAVDAFERAGDPERAAEAAVDASWHAWHTRPAEARGRLDRATAILDGRPPSRATALVLAENARMLMMNFQVESGRREAKRA